MEQLKEALLTEQSRLEEIQAQILVRMDQAPEGRLRLSRCREKPQYYHYLSPEKRNGNYISEKNIDLISKLAQKSYDEKVLKLIQKKKKKLSQFLEEYPNDEIEQIYLRENNVRRKYIKPVEMTWEQKVKQWMETEYQPKDFMEGVPVIMTEKGERVRSKSEKILADFFYRNNIPYKYEKPLYLKNFGVVHPDFTFLSPTSKQEIFWEHNGRMDDPNYVERAIRKIQAYEANDIYPGERLILTFETQKNILDDRMIRRHVNKYLQ